MVVSRTPLMLVALFALGFMAILGYTRSTREEPAEQAPVDKIASRPTAPANAEPPPPSDAGVVQPSTEAQSESGSPEAVSPEIVAKWVVDATSEDASKRPPAIAALAKAPKADAVPVLKTLLTAGTPGVDRPLALSSLRTLALEQGDADRGIRDLLRQAMYHADDEATAQGASEVIAAIDSGISDAAPAAVRH